AYPDLEFTFDLAKADDFKAQLLVELATPSDTQEALVKLLLSRDGEKEIVKKRKQVLTEFAKAITELKTKFNLALGTEVDEADASNWQFSMGQLDDKWSNIETSMTDQGTEIFEQIQELYRARLLNGIVPAGMSLS
ncbi:hypothetical protein KW818_23245, partial [Enterobacter quasiroggenkampii]|nr:hypothetical protein [Enterobacter quasiroggenkampii]